MPASPASPQTLALLDEAAVVARAQDGDLASFEYLVDTYQGTLFRICYRMLNDRGDAEDVTQEALIAGWRKLPTLINPAAFSGWIYHIATRLCINLIQTRARQHTDLTAGDDFETALPQHTREQQATAPADPAAAAEDTARERGLDAVLATLPAEQRACWVLKELHHLSYAEISTILHIPISTVRGRIARARPHLAEGMSPWH